MSEVAAPRKPSVPSWRAQHVHERGAGRALPDEVVEKTKHHILDTLAAMVSGSDLPPDARRSRLPAAMAGKIATVVGSNSSAARSKRRSSTACWRIPTRPTTRTRRRTRIRAARRARGARGRRTVRRSTARASCAPSRSATTSAPRVTMTHGRPASRRRPTTARTASPASSARRRPRLRRRAQRAADALAARLHRAAVPRASPPGSATRDHIEKALRLRRHAGAQRRHRGAAGPAGLDRRRRHLLRRRQFLPGVRAHGRSGEARSTSSASATRSRGPTSRSGPSARRSRRRSTRSRTSAEAPPVRRRSGAEGRRARGHERGQRRSTIARCPTSACSTWSP